MFYDIGPRSSLDHRRKEKIRKNDFIDLILDALKDYQVIKICFFDEN